MNEIETEYQRIFNSYLQLPNSNKSVLEAHQLYSK